MQHALMQVSDIIMLPYRNTKMLGESKILTNWTIMKASDGSHVTGAFLGAPRDDQQMLLRLCLC